MSRRVFTPNDRKEQLKQQVFVMMRIIRRKLDADVLRSAELAARSAQGLDRLMEPSEASAGATKPHPHGAAVSVSGNASTIPYDQESARKAIAHYIALNKGNKDMCLRLMNMMRSS